MTVGVVIPVGQRTTVELGPQFEALTRQTRQGPVSLVVSCNGEPVHLVEALIAFILVFTVISTTTDPRVPAGTAAVAIGFSLAAGVLLGGPVSGGAGNPARALGPMIVSGTFPVWFFYTIGPFVGAVAAAGAFRDWPLTSEALSR